jgi:hypothetical protein
MFVRRDVVLDVTLMALMVAEVAREGECRKEDQRSGGSAEMVASCLPEESDER